MTDETTDTPDRFDHQAALIADAEQRGRAEALREAANETRLMPADSEKAARWLRDRADRIEAAGCSPTPGGAVDLIDLANYVVSGLHPLAEFHDDDDEPATQMAQAEAGRKIGISPVGIIVAGTTLMDADHETLIDVMAERQRQIALGYTPEHDDNHGPDEVASFARRYVQRGANAPGWDTTAEAYVKAAAVLIAAAASARRRARSED